MLLMAGRQASFFVLAVIYCAMAGLSSLEINSLLGQAWQIACLVPDFIGGYILSTLGWRGVSRG
jgi:hypothetical protein